jgi:hypothetical protein
MKKGDIKKVIDRLKVGNVREGELKQLEKVLVIWLDASDARSLGLVDERKNKAIILQCMKSQDIGIACWPLLEVPELFKIKQGKPILLDFGRQMVDILVKDEQLVIWATCQNGFVKPLAIKFMLLMEMLTAKQTWESAYRILIAENPEAEKLPKDLWAWLAGDVGSGSVLEVIRWR